MSEQPPASLTSPPQGYASLLADIKQRVRQAQVRAMLSVNAELIRLYWGIGQTIHQADAGVLPGVRPIPPTPKVPQAVALFTVELIGLGP